MQRLDKVIFELEHKQMSVGMFCDIVKGANQSFPDLKFDCSNSNSTFNRLSEFVVVAIVNDVC